MMPVNPCDQSTNFLPALHDCFINLKSIANIAMGDSTRRGPAHEFIYKLKCLEKEVYLVSTKLKETLKKNECLVKELEQEKEKCRKKAIRIHELQAHLHSAEVKLKSRMNQLRNQRATSPNYSNNVIKPLPSPKPHTNPNTATKRVQNKKKIETSADLLNSINNLRSTAHSTLNSIRNLITPKENQDGNHSSNEDKNKNIKPINNDVAVADVNAVTNKISNNEKNVKNLEDNILNVNNNNFKSHIEQAANIYSKLYDNKKKQLEETVHSLQTENSELQKTIQLKDKLLKNQNVHILKPITKLNDYACSSKSKSSTSSKLSSRDSDLEISGGKKVATKHWDNPDFPFKLLQSMQKNIQKLRKTKYGVLPTEGHERKVTSVISKNKNKMSAALDILESRNNTIKEKIYKYFDQ